MEPVAVGVEGIFDVTIVPFYAVFFGEGPGRVPGFALDFEAPQVGFKIGVAAEGVAEFVEELEACVFIGRADENCAVLIGKTGPI